jgi:hypothetical protein
LLGQVGQIIAKIEKRADEVKGKWIAERDALTAAQEQLESDYDAAKAGPWTKERSARDDTVASAEKETAALIKEAEGKVAKKDQAQAHAASVLDAKKKALKMVQMGVRVKENDLEDFGEEARQEYSSAVAKARAELESNRAVAEADNARRTKMLGETVSTGRAKCDAALDEWHTMSKMDESMISSISDALEECAQNCGDVHFLEVAEVTKGAVTASQASAIHQSYWLQLGERATKKAQPQQQQQQQQKLTETEKPALAEPGSGLSGSGSSSGSDISPYGAVAEFADNVQKVETVDKIHDSMPIDHWTAAVSQAVSRGEAEHAACLEHWDAFSRKDLEHFHALKEDNLRRAAERLKREEEAATSLRDDVLRRLRDAVTESGVHIPDLEAEVSAAKTAFDMAKVANDEAVATEHKVEDQRSEFEEMVKNDAQSKMDADVNMQKATLLEAKNEKGGEIDIEHENRKSEFEGRMRDVQSELDAVRSIESKLKDLLEYSTHKETELVLLSTSMDPGSRIGDFSSGEQRGELVEAAVADYRLGKTGAQLAEAGLFKLKVRDVTTGKTVVFQFEDGEKPGIGFDKADRDCSAPGARLGKLTNGKDLFWHAGVGGCFNGAHIGFSIGAAPLMDCKDDTKAANADIMMHWGHFHRRNIEVSSMYAFGTHCMPEEHGDDGREILKHRMVVTGYFSDMPDLAKQIDPNADEAMFEEKPVKEQREMIDETLGETGVMDEEEKSTLLAETGPAEDGGEGADVPSGNELEKNSLEGWAGEKVPVKLPEVVPEKVPEAPEEVVTEKVAPEKVPEVPEKKPEEPEKAPEEPEKKEAPEPTETPGPDGNKLEKNTADNLEGWAGEDAASPQRGSASTSNLRRR